MQLTLRSIEHLDVGGKRALVRVDFNVPLEAGSVSDDTRIRAALPTIEYLRQRQARVVLASHLGRPAGEPDPKFSLAPVADRLSTILQSPIRFVSDCIGEAAEAAVSGLSAGEVLLLENTRFHSGEKANDPAFARQLAALADCFVNDAFGTAHRAHASTEAVARLLPSAAGFLILKEVAELSRAIHEPAHPYVAILGGAKISDKIKVVERFLELADLLLIGGGMANTFLAAEGAPMANSLVEADALQLARELKDRAGDKLKLPADLVVAEAFEAEAKAQVVAADSVPDGWQALDIGPATVAAYIEAINPAKLVVWNGPMGVFEMPKFAVGTQALARAVAEISGVSIIGGGDSAAAVEQAGVADRVTHVSTGGGAALALLGGESLPALESLRLN